MCIACRKWYLQLKVLRTVKEGPLPGNPGELTDNKVSPHRREVQVNEYRWFPICIYKFIDACIHFHFLYKSRVTFLDLSFVTHSGSLCAAKHISLRFCESIMGKRRMQG